jgi:hypothetical protein
MIATIALFLCLLYLSPDPNDPNAVFAYLLSLSTSEPTGAPPDLRDPLSELELSQFLRHWLQGPSTVVSVMSPIPLTFDPNAPITPGNRYQVIRDSSGACGYVEYKPNPYDYDQSGACTMADFAQLSRIWLVFAKGPANEPNERTDESP